MSIQRFILFAVMIVSEAKRYREHVASNKTVELRINRFETFFAKPAFLSSFLSSFFPSNYLFDSFPPPFTGV